MAARVIACELIGDTAAARAALQSPDQRLRPRRVDGGIFTPNQDSHCAVIAKYSSWLNG
jgi:hypothetical protein